MLEIINTLPAPERRWVRSFEIANALFWAVPAIACVTQPGQCGMAAQIFPMLMYAPYWFWRLPFPSLTLGNFLDAVTMVASGLAVHYLIARFLGRRFNHRITPWYVSIPCAIATILIGAVGGMWLVTHFGLL